MSSRPFQATLIAILVVHTESWTLNRRNLLKSGVFSPIILFRPDNAEAARGAAELDFEFYIRDLIGGNKKEGNIAASAPPKPKDPRAMTTFASSILGTTYEADCLAVATLSKISSASTGDIQQRSTALRNKVSKSFYSRAPWSSETTLDQYFFDVSSYALWRTAADLLPVYSDRDKFVRELGRCIYQKLVSDGVLKSTSSGKISSTVPVLEATLQQFKDSGLCLSYKIGSDATKDDADLPLFDDIDDDALASGASVDCIVSIIEPATLGASLQITGEQSRFAPDLAGPTLAAIWEKASLKCTWETFFVDSEYRPNPKDYFPNEQLLQYTITKI